MHTALEKFRILIAAGRLRPAGTQIMIVSAMLLAASILLLWGSYSHLTHSLETDRRTNEAILLIDQVELKLVGVEQTVRGYALTGDRAFLGWGGNERRDLSRAMSGLAAAMDQEPDQKARFRDMRRLVNQRLDLYAYLVRPEHAKDVGRAMLDPRKRLVMSKARRLLADLRRTQTHLLQIRQADTARNARMTLYLATGIVLLAFVSVVFGIVLIQGGNVRPEL